jgi:hypothetical protein
MEGTRSRSRGRARGNGSPCEEEEDILMAPLEQQEVLRPRSPREYFEHIASFTSPGFSLFFILFFVVIAIFHENYSAQTSVAIACWFLIQLVSYVLREDFSNELFWNILGLLGSVLVYVLVGHLWSYAKLYVDLWQKHLDPIMINKFRTCASTPVGDGCMLPLLLEMKWHIVHSTLTWPVSMIHTLSRDPLRILTDMLFEASRARYMAVIRSALDTTPNESSASWILLWWFGSIFGYLVIGYIYTHVKLFFDVWQGTLPKSIDDQVRAVYAGNQNYFAFVVSIKWLVMQWMFTWPLSFIYTLFRHPLRLLSDFVYQLSTRKYAWLVSRAMTLRNKKQE